MNEKVKKLKCKAVVETKVSKDIRGFYVTAQREQLFKKLAQEVEDSEWYLIKLKQTEKDAVNSFETGFDSELKYLAIKDISTHYSNALQVAGDSDEITGGVFTCISHDDVLAELEVAKIELEDYKRAYEELKEKYKERKEKHHQLMIDYNRLVDEEENLMQAITDEGYSIEFYGRSGVRL